MNNIDISLSELEEDPVEKALAADASERERIFGECQQVCQPFTSFLESSGYVNLSQIKQMLRNFLDYKTSSSRLRTDFCACLNIVFTLA